MFPSQQATEWQEIKTLALFHFSVPAIFIVTPLQRLKVMQFTESLCRLQTPCEPRCRLGNQEERDKICTFPFHNKRQVLQIQCREFKKWTFTCTALCSTVGVSGWVGFCLFTMLFATDHISKDNWGCSPRRSRRDASVTLSRIMGLVA